MVNGHVCQVIVDEEMFIQRRQHVSGKTGIKSEWSLIMIPIHSH